MNKPNNGVIADTCVWIEFFKSRSGSVIGKELEELIVNDSVCVSGIIVYELTQGVKSDAEKAKIINALSNLKCMEMSKHLWQKAGDISGLLRKNGLNIPLSDILIASIAIEHNLSVFTIDGHFEKIPGLNIYKI